MEDAPKFEAIDKTPPMLEEVEPEFHQNEPLISLHALSGISAPKTLKILGSLSIAK